MDRIKNSSNISNAKNLRKNMTREERHLWYDFLRNYPVRFYRQKIFGKYILDFYCAKAKLVIELDGSQHFEGKAISYDEERDSYLKEYGLEIIRIPNNELNKNFRDICDYIDLLVRKRISGR